LLMFKIITHLNNKTFMPEEQSSHNDEHHNFDLNLIYITHAQFQLLSYSFYNFIEFMTKHCWTEKKQHYTRMHNDESS